MRILLFPVCLLTRHRAETLYTDDDRCQRCGLYRNTGSGSWLTGRKLRKDRDDARARLLAQRL